MGLTTNANNKRLTDKRGRIVASAGKVFDA
jgi:hypothetical protein